jgi:hypothetical protein
VLLEEWIPPAKPRTRREALAELALRYFTSHGPATLKDFSWWSGLSSADARSGLESAAPQLVRASVDEQDFWSPRDERSGTSTSPAALLLPPFDEFLVAYRDRRRTVDPAHAGHLHSLLSPTIAVKGRIIVPRFFGRPGSGELRLIETAARRYGAYLGLPAELQ